MNKRATKHATQSAFRFVFIMGIVNLFGDVTYEGGAAINGQFLGSLGASAAAISVIAGLGEFLGYSLRLPAGYIADKTGRYWFVTYIGYFINTLAVPAMALAGSWQAAGALVLAERIGRAIRKPTVEAMLSYTTGTLGRGWVYALNTALDEIGATIGPLIVAAVLFLHGDYRTGYAALLISAVLALISSAVAWIGFPVPAKLEEGKSATAKGFAGAYWLYMAGGALFAAGLMSYELIAYHLSRTGILSGPWIPVLLAFATGSGVIANLVLGRIYDRYPMPAVLVGVFSSACFAPLAFQGSLPAIVLAMPLLGIGYAVQDTVLKAVVAGLLPEGQRGFAFGLFYTGYGVGWLVGSIAMGLLYERSQLLLIVFMALMQLLSAPVFVAAARLDRKAADV
jgi:MFS family permease